MSFSKTPFIPSPISQKRKEKEQKKKEPLFKDIPSWVKKENVYFNKLLQDIEEKNLLDNDGAFTRIKDYYEVADYKSVKKDYLENKILYEVVLDLVNGIKVADSTGNMNEVNKTKCYEIINNLIKCEQIKQNLEMIPNEKNDVMKLEEMKNDIINKFKEEEIEQFPTISNSNSNTIPKDNTQENIIIDKDKSLIDLTLNIEEDSIDDISNSDIGDKTPLENVDLSNINTNILGLTEETINDRISIYNKDIVKFFCETLETLYKILIHHKCQKYTELNAAFNNYYSAIIENIFLKLNVLKVEIMESLYTEETISALINIRETFILKKEEVENQLNILNNRLIEYEYAGEEFNELATDYSNIINEIRIMNNDIEKMNQS